MAEKRIIREHPAILCDVERDDLERIYVTDAGGKKRYPFKVVETGEIVSETLIAYPNEAEFEIIED